VQFYIKDTSEYAVPNYSLCGFKRVFIKKGESLMVSAAIDKSAFEAVDNDGNRKIFGKEFTLYAEFHSRISLSEKLTGTKCASTKIIL
jgi:beta-glucosidase